MQIVKHQTDPEKVKEFEAYCSKIFFLYVFLCIVVLLPTNRHFIIFTHRIKNYLIDQLTHEQHEI